MVVAFVLRIDCIDFIHHSSPNPLQLWQTHCSLFATSIIGSVSDAAENYACHFRAHRNLPFIRVSQLHLSAPVRGWENPLEYKWGQMRLRATEHQQNMREVWGNILRGIMTVGRHAGFDVRGWNALICALCTGRLAGSLARPAESLGVKVKLISGRLRASRSYTSAGFLKCSESSDGFYQ